MRILLVSQMYPGPDAPDLGVFVRGLEEQLVALGHTVERAVLDSRAGGKRRYVELFQRARVAARAHRPDVVYAHFLCPTGTIAARVARSVGAPLVLTAHGRDVRNIGAVPGVRMLTRYATRRGAAVIAVSAHLAHELEARLPELAGRIEVIDCGVDLERFAPREQGAARRAVGLEAEGPVFLHVGTLDERKNVARLAEAFAQLGRGQLVFVGDGPLRHGLEGRPGIRVVGRVPHDAVATWIAAADVVCQPSMVEPFGQALVEALACARTVVATRIGGPPEYVTPGAGVLVDPASVESIARGLADAAELPTPNPAARAAAEPHDVRRQAARIAELLERATRQ